MNRKVSVSLCLILGLWFVVSCMQALALESASKVLVVYNSNYTIDSDGDGVQDSLEVASYYAAARGIPASQILGVPATVSESNTYNTFAQLNTDILTPIQNKLNVLGPTNIDIIMLCYGLPYKLLGSPTVSIDNVVMGLGWNMTWGSDIQEDNPYYEVNPLFDPNVKGHFNHADYYFLDGQKYAIYLVTRLDGPLGVGGVLDLIDRGLYADKYLVGQPGFFTGTAYIDDENRLSSTTYTDALLPTYTCCDGQLNYLTSGDWGDYNGVDVNIAYGEHYVLYNSPQASLSLKWQSTGKIIGTPGLLYTDGTSAVTAPDALLYAGWYGENDYIPSAWQWLPGAVGSDYDSASMAYPLQSPMSIAWAVQALTHGITATCGNVAEPGTGSATANSVLLYYMLQGYTFAEAAALSNPAVGGAQVMCIGDPLFTPYSSKSAVLDTSIPIFTTAPVLTQTQEYGAVATGEINTSVTQPAIATFTLGYGDSPATDFSSWAQQVTGTEGYTRRYSLTATNLRPSTTYYYQIQAQGPPPGYNTAVSTTGSFTTPAETAFVSQSVPGTIALADFDNGEEGVSWFTPWPSTAVIQKRGATGIPIGSSGAITEMYAGEWLNYTIDVTATGSYELDIDACDCYGGSDGSTFNMSIDGVDVTGLVTMPNMNKTFEDIIMATGVHISAGTHVLQLYMDSGKPAAPVTAATESIGQFLNITIH
jgi:hypothetical protein